MAKGEAKVEELVDKIESGALRLPEMQRRYVWRATRIRDLLDSLYRDYPSGAILVWETDEAVPLQDFAVAQNVAPYKSNLLLLDGQQRLTSLSAVIRGVPVTVRGRKKPIEILFNLEHPDGLEVVTEVDDEGGEEEDDHDSDEDGDDLDSEDADASDDELQKRFNKMTFVVGTKKLAQLPHWVKVTEVFKTDSDLPFLQRAGVTQLGDPRAEKYSKRLAKLRAIRKYVYRMDILEKHLSYDEVTEIFVRVNSLGAKLRSSDLALAQITAKWKGSLQIFTAFQDACAKQGFELDLGIHLKNLVAFATNQSRFLSVGGIRKEDLQAAWDQSLKGMQFALNFLKSNAGIDNPALLSSPFLLVTVAKFGHQRGYKLTEADAKRLRQWVVLANAKGRYSRGSSETLLDQDLTVLKSGGGPEELIERLRLQVGRLDVSPEELEGRNQRSALFKTMFLAFRSRGASDWHSGLRIALKHSGAQHHLQFHHIFPKAILKGTYSAREADDIANLAFIASKTNQVIGKGRPYEYIPKLLERGGLANLDNQCIPTDMALLDVDSFKVFLAELRKKISVCLNEFLGVK